MVEQERRYMRSRQAGITFIGWIVLLIPVAIVAFAGIKLSTLYMNNFKVSKVLEQTAKTSEAATVTPMAVRLEIERRFDIEGIEVPAPADIIIEKDGDTWVLAAEYTRETELFGNLSLLVHFNKRAVIQ
jgi:hypothetical protein